MATDSIRENLKQPEEEENEEVLSLCDLPIMNLINGKDKSGKQDLKIIETEDEFVFGSSKESEICSADEVFFQGKILPLHSSSTRSSSLRSQSSSLNSSTTFSTTTTARILKPIVQDQFHTHYSSPKPRLKTVTVSPAWDLLRLGVMPAPEIALEELKVRNTNSANKNYVSSSVQMSIQDTDHIGNKMNRIFKQLVGKGGGLSSGCKCPVETVQLNVIKIKIGAKSTDKTESAMHEATKEKVIIKLKKQKEKEKQGKKTLSRNRTVEWIRELSLVNYPYED